MYVEFVLGLLQLGRKCLYYGHKKSYTPNQLFFLKLWYTTIRIICFIPQNIYVN